MSLGTWTSRVYGELPSLDYNEAISSHMPGERSKKCWLRFNVAAKATTLNSLGPLPIIQATTRRLHTLRVQVPTELTRTLGFYIGRELLTIIVWAKYSLFVDLDLRDIITLNHN